MENEEIGIQVNLAGKEFKLKINRNDERKYRIAARQLNEKVLRYQEGMKDCELEDILRMVALDFAFKINEPDL